MQKTPPQGASPLTLLVRHGRAQAPASGEDQRQRSLTSAGRRRVRAAVAGLATLGVELDRVYTSPWLRAHETAELMQPLLAEGGEILSTDGLARPPSDALLGTLEGDRIALVGHEPWLGELCAWLLSGWHEDGRNLSFRKAGVAWLEGPREAGRMQLRAFLPPRFLRSLGE